MHRPNITNSRCVGRSRTSVLRSVAVVVATGLILTGCTAQDPLAQEAGTTNNYVSGSGSVTEYAPGKRGEPVSFESRLLDGTPVDSSTWSDKVVVLNFWYAACAPCRKEAPTLAKLSKAFKPQGVEFYGVNLRDDMSTADAFERSFGVTFPSFDDRNGTVLLAMTKYVPPQAVPTTIVLDKQRRVAGRILGVAEESTLKAIITGAMAGK